jgi:ferredoxin|tara:strand:- start:1109 stop:1354 length:246 start_codon:yes stop_codon:yes gene_type:complete
MKKCYFLHERESCIGCGACATIDPKNWRMNKDGKSDLLDSEKINTDEKKEFNNKDLEKNIETAQCCPVNVIHIHKEGKKLI